MILYNRDDNIVQVLSTLSLSHPFLYISLLCFAKFFNIFISDSAGLLSNNLTFHKLQKSHCLDPVLDHCPDIVQSICTVMENFV